MYEAKYYEKLNDGRLHCYLCPRHCKIGDGQNGFCFIRKNEGGKLYQLAYNQPFAINVDPIEKKPLYHFLPGTSILSLGTAGCNMGCKFCQNWNMSKAEHHHNKTFEFPAHEAAATAKNHRCASMAYTYNEPTIWAEYVEDLSATAHADGLKNVMVTNGYITPEVIDSVYQHIDAANVDLKAFTEDFYKKVTLTHLEPVLETLKILYEKGVWIELTTLVIPTMNDDAEEITEMAEWVLDNLGPNVPMHFSAFHPDYKLRNKPSTSPETLEQVRKLAMDIGVKYAYVGNVMSESGNTYCPSCGHTLIQRRWQSVHKNGIENGRCPKCSEKVPGVFKEARHLQNSIK